MTRILSLIGMVLQLSAAMDAQAGDRLFQGEIVATDACSSCHQVGPHHQRPEAVYNDSRDLDVYAPSFRLIARIYGDNREAIRRKVLVPPHPMPRHRLTNAQLNEVIDYIISLNREPAGSRAVTPN